MQHDGYLKNSGAELSPRIGELEALQALVKISGLQHGLRSIHPRVIESILGSETLLLFNVEHPDHSIWRVPAEKWAN